jgi:hypothetical protein
MGQSLSEDHAKFPMRLFQKKMVEQEGTEVAKDG